MRKGVDIVKVCNKFEPPEDFDGSQGDNASSKRYVWEKIQPAVRGLSVDRRASVQVTDSQGSM